MFGRYDTCQTVNKPVRDAVYYRLKSIQRRAVRPGLVSPDWETNLYFCGVVNKYQNNHSYAASSSFGLLLLLLRSSASVVSGSHHLTSDCLWVPTVMKPLSASFTSA